MTIPSIFYQNSETKNKQNQKKADKQEIDKNKSISKSTNNKNIDGNIATVIENLKQEIKKINDEFNISYSVKTIGLNNKKNFLFHDYQYHTIVADEKSFIYLQQDEKQQSTNVHFVKKDAVRADKPSIMSFLNVVRNFISYFKTAVKLIAENYQQIKIENAKPTDDAFSLDNAIKTFLAELKISQENQQYLIESIKTKQFEDKQKNNQQKNQQKNNQNNETPILKIPQNDRSFYNNGFRYYDFEDSEMHDTKSKIFITDFDTTPEKMLLNLASSNFIVGISATAKIKTVIGNYDLKYLKKNLKENFLALSAEENKQLKAIFEERNKDYVPIKVEFIGVENVQTSLTSFGFEKVIFNELLTEIERSADEYVQKRYLRIARAYQKFVENDNIQSFLCFLNTHPKYGNQGCDLKVLDMFFAAIIEKYQKNIDVKKSYFVLDSKDFDNKKTKILEDLRKGQKIFLITTYQTLGAGQNIQYGLNNFEALLAQNKIKQIFQREEDNTQNNTKHNTDYTTFEKDFDAIYLDKPTNLLVNADGELTELTDFDVNKRIFQAEMLSEANQIFRKQVIYEIRRTFKKAYYKDRNFDVFFPQESYKSLFETRDYKNFVSKQIIQAIGRINRTNFKNNEIYIFADKEIAPSIKYFHNDEDNLDTIYLKEFEALQEKAKLEIEKSANNNGNNEDNELKINIERINLHCHEWINAKVKGKYWSDPNIMAWQKLREISLKYPTVSKQELDNLEELKNWEFIYLPMLTADYKDFTPKNKYCFGQKEDYKNIEVDFSENKNNHTEISAKAVYLPQLMQIEVIKAFFEEKNYATDFQENDYMLAPQIFNGIYKGALGEEIGKFILENYVIPKQTLQELPAPIFERFDFMLDEGIFIDFKFWNDENIQDRDEQIKKIFELKVKDIQKKGFEFQKVFIINILAKNKFDIIVSNNGKLIEVPYLIDKNTGKIDENMILQLRKLLI